MILTKLKAECGYHFTSKMEGMLTDLRISMDEMDAYSQSRQFPLSDMDVSIQVFTSGYWPPTGEDFD